MENRKLLKAVILASAACTVLSFNVRANAGPDTLNRVEMSAALIAADMARLCPAADVGDQAAFDTCRKGLYADSQLRRSLKPFGL